ncbi:MAG: ionic transporter y4hA [Methylobacteriaceae bacterium]|nr:ionic transporter y4hA [Methylobacteriaceae bacterium]
MAQRRFGSLWLIATPFVALAFYGASAALRGRGLDVALDLLLGPILLAAVFASVHHAEVIAHRLGEPYGTLVLTMTVTIIEVALIVSVQLAGEGGETLARDTVFSVIMIVCNGIVGLCVLIGGLRYGEQGFRITGANAYLIVLATIAAMTLVLPNTTVAEAGPVYSARQLVFFSAATLVLYLVFLYIQTVRHRDYFMTFDEPHDAGGVAVDTRAAWFSAGLLLVALIAVVAMSKQASLLLEAGSRRFGYPQAVVGAIVALIILLPETVAALRAARRDELQKSVNLALGSTVATIGLTIPVVAAVNVWLGHKLVLGLTPSNVALLAVTMFASLITFGTGRTNVLYGAVHLVLFGAFLFLAFEP